MMYFYAELDENDICKATSELSGPQSGDRFIERDPSDETMEGKRRVGDSWVEVVYGREVIPNKELWNRFTPAERRTLAGSSNNRIKAFLYGLRLQPDVDLTDQDLFDDLTAAYNAGIISTPVNELLRTE